MDDACRNERARGGHSRRLLAGVALMLCAGLASPELRAEPPLPLILRPPAPATQSPLPTLPPPAAPASPIPEPVAPSEPPRRVELQLEPAASNDLTPWWRQRVSQPLKRGVEARSLAPESIVLATLEHSAQVRVLSESPLIRRQTITEAQSRFCVRTFMDTKFLDASDPVGSLLTTGGADRYLDQNLRYAAGVRKRTAAGGEFEVSQRIGYQDTNSIYFVPPNQGTAKLTVGFTQPLLNGAGCAYNQSMIVIAQVETAAASEQMSRQLQALLVEVHRAYWELYLQRSVLLQKLKLYDEAVAIRDELQARREVDVLGSQLVRAQAAVASRQAAIIRYQTSVRNAEARLSALVNDPAWLTGQAFELVPAEAPTLLPPSVSLQDALGEALHKRPEINQAAAEIRAASVRAEMARNELLPVLNLILESYVSGLQGDTGIIPALGDQYSTGRPTYSAGLVFEYPLGNCGAKARLTQKRLEVRQLTNQLRALTANIRAEVEVAVREVATTHKELVSKRYAMSAEETEIQYLQERWRLLPDDQQGAGVVLDDVLRAQERLAEAELEFARSQLAYNMALVELKRVTGSLLEWEAISPMEMCQDCLPTLRPTKAGSVGTTPAPNRPVESIEAPVPTPTRAPTPAETITERTTIRPMPRLPVAR